MKYKLEGESKGFFYFLIKSSMGSLEAMITFNFFFIHLLIIHAVSIFKKKKPISENVRRIKLSLKLADESSCQRNKNKTS